jgi:hypothetical protein
MVPQAPSVWSAPAQPWRSPFKMGGPEPVALAFQDGGPEMAPKSPQHSERPGEPVALLYSRDSRARAKRAMATMRGVCDHARAKAGGGGLENR